MSIRCLIADDEPLARQRLRDLLAEAEGFEVAGECEDGLATLGAVEKLRPDLLFLDVQMPGLDGFEVLEHLHDARPMIVFTTAYDAYAVRAFDEHALDYLLKPIDASRFRESLQRAVKAMTTGRNEWSERIVSLLARIERQSAALRRIVIKTPNRVFFVETREVDWFEATGNYVRVHAAGDAHLVRMTLHSLEARLDRRSFARVHRSTIVNLNRVASLEPALRSDYTIILKDGTRLPVQRSYRERLREALGDF